MNAKVSVVVDGKEDFGLTDLPSSMHLVRYYVMREGGYCVRVEGEVNSSVCSVIVEVPSIPFSMCRTGLRGDTCTDVFKKSVKRSYADMMQGHPVILLSKRQRMAIYAYTGALHLPTFIDVLEQRWEVSGVLKGKTMVFTKASIGDKSCYEVSIGCKHEKRGEYLSLLVQFVVEAGSDVSMKHERYNSVLMPDMFCSDRASSCKCVPKS